MTSIAETTNRPAPAGSAGRNVNLRSFLAGGAATSALIAGAIVVFASLAAYVAFNGLPGGGDDANSERTVQVRAAGAPEAAAAAVGGAPAAVAAAPAAPTPAAPAPAVAPAPAAPVATGTTPAPVAVDPTAPQTTVETSTGTPVPTQPPATAEESGPVGGVIDGLDNTVSNLGLDLPLSESTSGLTGAVDQTVQTTLNNVGGLLGNPQLGQQVGSTVNGVTNNLLGPGGVTDQLLGQ